MQTDPEDGWSDPLVAHRPKELEMLTGPELVNLASIAGRDVGPTENAVGNRGGKICMNSDQGDGMKNTKGKGSAAQRRVRSRPVSLVLRGLVYRYVTPTTLVFSAIFVIGLMRLWTLGTLALTDNTEARYAGISWHMFRSGDWITPRVYLSGQLVPFWAKPPLFFWLTSLSFQTCGASEWAARLPNFLIAAGVVGLTIAFGRRFWGPRVGAIAGVILASSGLFFVLAGSCILDMSLAGSICLALMSFALFADGYLQRAEGLIPSVRAQRGVERAKRAHRVARLRGWLR